MTSNDDEEKRKVLKQLWRRIEKRIASDEERVHAARLASQVGQEEDRPHIWALLNDSCSDARDYSLKALAVQLADDSLQLEETCWKALIDDPSEDVRARAARCLGRILWLRPSTAAFRRLVAPLKSQHESTVTKAAIYDSLFLVAHRPPGEWPGLSGPKRGFQSNDIDWNQVAYLEDQVRELEAASRHGTA